VGLALVPGERGRGPAAQTLARLPLVFEANRGQAESDIRFYARAATHTLHVRRDADAIVTLSDGQAVTMHLARANKSPHIEGLEQRPGVANYLLGNDPSKWCTGVPFHGRVRCHDVYDGIDLEYYSRDGLFEYDFVVAPHVDPGVIELTFDGADDVKLEPSGDLVVRAGEHELRHHKPYIHQDGDRIAGAFVLRGDGGVGFSVGAYDRSQPLVIDPILTHSTYLGGSGQEWAIDIATDSAGAHYVTGWTESLDFPGATGHAGSRDVFVTKIDTDGTEIVYSTYIGGTLDENTSGIAVDDSGCAYVSGTTDSTDFPALDLQLANAGGTDGFVVKLNAAGDALVYATYLGGTANEIATDVAVDAAGHAYVCGQTRSSDFPIESPPIPVSGTFVEGDNFLTKFGPNGASLVYSVRWGGGSIERATGVDVDAAGAAYVVGQTASFPQPPGTPPTILPFRSGGGGDNYILKFNASGVGVDYFSYIGGTGNDAAFASVAVDAEGAAFISGATRSTDFPTINAFQDTFGGGELDGFLAKINAGGTAVEFSTYFSGTETDVIYDVAVDDDFVYVSGSASSPNLPLVDPLQDTLGADTDPFLAKFTKDGATLVFSTLLGGSRGGREGSPTRLALDSFGNVYLTGFTQSLDYPGVADSPIQPAKSVGYDGFVAKISVDTDGDGLPDDWEEDGFYARNGEFVNLPAMGANPLRKDIFVEVDYMRSEQFNHMPNCESIFGSADGFEGIVGVFARAPVDNPDGSTGIALHVIIDDEIGFVAELGAESVRGKYDWEGNDPAATYFEDLKQAHFTPSLRQVAHYCIFAHKLEFDNQTVSGMSRGSDATGFAASEFVVSLGGVGVAGIGSMAQQAGTFMHELGHDLGLRHGGGDGINNKPNYLSVMSHAFQMSGLVGGTFDYSRWALPDLNENSQLNETIGINGGAAIAGLGTKWFCGPSDPRTTPDANAPINWNCTGEVDETGVRADINGDELPSGFSAAPILTGFDDWSNLVFRGGAIGAAGSSEPPPVTEPPPEVNEEVVAALGPPAPTNLSGHPSDPQNTLSWKKVGVGLTYNVYRAAGGEVEFLGNTPNTNWHDKTAEDGVAYEYSVATVDEFGTEGPAASVTVTAR
jgi:hypothetical protein